MNPRRPYRPGRKKRGLAGQERSASAWLLLVLPAAALAFIFLFRSRAADSGAATATPAVASPRPPLRSLTAPALPVTVTPEPPLPTSTSAFLVEPSPSPTAIMAAAPTQFYTTQSGDTLPALAARFGVNPADISAPAGLHGATSLADGQLLVIPQVLEALGPAYRIIPDSELVFSGAGAGFDPRQFAGEQGGYLSRYEGYADNMTRGGGDVVLLVASHHSVNPRLLVGLLEYQSGWVTNPQPEGESLAHPLGWADPHRKALQSQLNWAASQLSIGYYGWRTGTLTELRFPDGTTLRLDPTLNAGTVALQYFFAQTRNRPAWDEAVGQYGFAATYTALLGDPFARALNPLIPADLTQPPLALPFLAGHTWYYSGGPHNAWQNNGVWAALDFAPSSLEGGCAESQEWVTAMAAGLVVRAANGVVLLDLDGDGREGTGWVILYLHLADADQVEQGAFVEMGDRIGHPSCEGGHSTGTHVHVARKYNGEWLPADGAIPFNLSGWSAGQGRQEYLGTLARDGQVIEACTCTASWTAITRDS